MLAWINRAISFLTSVLNLMGLACAVDSALGLNWIPDSVCENLPD